MNGRQKLPTCAVCNKAVDSCEVDRDILRNEVVLVMRCHGAQDVVRRRIDDVLAKPAELEELQRNTLLTVPDVAFVKASTFESREIALDGPPLPVISDAAAALSERFGRAVAVVADPCGFCGKHPREVKRMVAAETGALICEECVYLAAKHLVADGWVPPGMSIKVLPVDAPFSIDVGFDELIVAPGIALGEDPSR